VSLKFPYQRQEKRFLPSSTPLTEHLPISGDCACSVLEHQTKQPKPYKNWSAETRAVIGSCCFVLVAVAVYFALITQRSKVKSFPRNLRRLNKPPFYFGLQTIFIIIRSIGGKKIGGKTSVRGQNSHIQKSTFSMSVMLGVPATRDLLTTILFPSGNTSNWDRPLYARRIFAWAEWHTWRKNKAFGWGLRKPIYKDAVFGEGLMESEVLRLTMEYSPNHIKTFSVACKLPGVG